ncbi:16S/23S rRNA (cytidine-2'-O)-methyltransferase TlyA [bacterium HR19]|nr:16S/23S rRNA (cytidine-2'-O)-methyltransferase TlyA [bacterium HR19]
MKERIDVLLVKKGIVESREKAKELIISGKVKVNGSYVLKPSQMVEENSVIELEENIDYVSRGFLKIKGAFERLNLSVEGKVCADIGSSTGGFTQFLLSAGAKKVYAIDIGKGLLADKLRRDLRVVIMEGVDAKYIREEDFDEKIDFASCDVSFTSSIPILRNIKFIPDVLLLCKPNFEVPRKFLKDGILKDKKLISLAIKKVISQVEDIFWVQDITFSFPLGSSGNMEFFILFKKKELCKRKLDEREIDEKVQKSILDLERLIQEEKKPSF